MTDVIRIVGERKLVKSDSTTETSSKTIQNTTETWETTKKGKGYKKVEIPLGGKVDAPTRCLNSYHFLQNYDANRMLFFRKFFVRGLCGTFRQPSA